MRCTYIAHGQGYIPVLKSYYYNCKVYRIYHVSYCMCVSCVVVSIILHIISVFIQDGDTALILAAMYNKTEVAALLIESGVNIDLQDKVLYMYSFMLMNICSSRYYG